MQWSLLLYNFQWQSKLSVHAHLDGYVKALFSMCPDIPPSLSGLEHVCICIPFPGWWWVQALFCTGQSQEEETGSIQREAKRDGSHSLGTGPLPHLRNVLSAVRLIKVLSSWAITSLSLWILATMRQDQEILPAWIVVSPSFQIFVMMKQELRERNKWPDGYILCNSGTLPKPEKCYSCNVHI